MDQFFFGKMASSSQSTPKASDHSPVQDSDEGLDNDHDTTGERFSFVSVDDSHKHQISDDSGITISSKEADNEFSGENSVFFSALSVRIDDIGKKAQDLIEKINESRAKDQEIMNNFQDKLVNKVSEVCQQVKEQMFSSYEKNGHMMEDRLLELSEILDKSSQLNTDLQAASQTLVVINKGLQQASQQ